LKVIAVKRRAGKDALRIGHKKPGIEAGFFKKQLM
jgi:hypothetical protein